MQWPIQKCELKQVITITYIITFFSWHLPVSGNLPRRKEVGPLWKQNVNMKVLRVIKAVVMNFAIFLEYNAV
jgi:hypothetical protein